MATATKKLTILMEADVHRALHAQIGRGHIGKFLSDVARPLLVTQTSLSDAYTEMAQDEAREKLALEWSESLITDSYGAQER